MRRVVITGLGVVSPLGITADEVTDSLRTGRSGVRFEESYAERGFRSQVAAVPQITLADHVDKRALRFMGPGAGYAHVAMAQAIADAGLTPDEVSNERTGLIAGSGGPSTSAMLMAHESVRKTGATKRIGPFAVPKCMSSTISANLATAYKVRGINYSITSACSTSLHCIGNAMEQIQLGKQDVMFAGGAEEVDWTLSCLFDAMGAMSSKYNASPETASRPFDVNRDGFVISGGGGILVLEALDRAEARGAKIYAEITGYGATSDGADMVAPSGEGGARSMRQALATIGNRRVDYVNAHGTSTPAGDVTEVEAVREVFGEGHVPPISSSKSLAGHSQGATGVLESIYALLMMEHRFLHASANIDDLDPGIRPGEVLTETRHDVDIDSVLSNSFGFGGTNASIILSKYHG